MNITNRIKRDIDIYNGITPDNKTITPSTFSIFTTLKMIFIFMIIILVIWYFYHTHISFKNITKIWDGFVTFINNGIAYVSKLFRSGKQPDKSQEATPTLTTDTNNKLPDIQQQKHSKELDTIKTALDSNALKYIATTEQTDNKDDIPGWCYIGKDTAGLGVCVRTNDESLCESNLFYKKEESCINQSSNE